jgi:N-acetylmuramate 1-kinase
MDPDACSGKGTASGVNWDQPDRAERFAQWLQQIASQFDLRPGTLRPASADASFRRYFRIDAGVGTRIIMDAPPRHENSTHFVRVATLMRQAGLRAPEVLARDEEQGFLLLTDLGSRTMMQSLDTEWPQRNIDLYLAAVDALVRWQCASLPGVLPSFDADMMRREMELFPEWYLCRHRGVEVDASMRKTLDGMFSIIIAECETWPSVFVHADFMPRNLMLPDGDPRMGVLDFQDALYGPITYDIGSLMRDAFLSWEEAFVIDVTIRYWEKARSAGLPVGDDFGAFYRGVEWMGLQRHLRIAGVFARLSLRDGKPHYLADAPRFIAYIRATATRYGALKPLLRLIDRVEGIAENSTYVFGRV